MVCIVRYKKKILNYLYDRKEINAETPIKIFVK